MPVKDLAFETLRVTVDGQVLTVTLDDTGNPLNLFTWQRMEELGELMSRLRDDTAVRAVVLTGSGRYFSGGGSFDLFATLDTSESAERMRRASRKLYKDMLEVGQPIVCAVNGPASRRRPRSRANSPAAPRSRSRTRSRCATGTSARSSSRRMRPASRSRCWTSGAATTTRRSQPSRRAGHRSSRDREEATGASHHRTFGKISKQ
jgi:hypothetical protein